MNCLLLITNQKVIYDFIPPKIQDVVGGGSGEAMRYINLHDFGLQFYFTY